MTRYVDLLLHELKDGKFTVRIHGCGGGLKQYPVKLRCGKMTTINLDAERDIDDEGDFEQ